LNLSKNLNLIEQRNLNLIKRFKQFHDEQKLGILYNWVLQRNITVEVFKKMIEHIIEKEMRDNEGFVA